MTDLYWIIALGKLGCIAELFAFLGGLASFVATLAFIIAMCEDFEDETKIIIRKSRNIAYIIFAISLMFVTFIPNTTQLYMIYGVGGTMDYLKSNPTARKLPDKCIRAFDKWADKLAEENEPKQE